MVQKVNDLCGMKESDTGLAVPSEWDLASDKQMMQEKQPLQVARCPNIINPGLDDSKYVINVKQIAKFVVGLGDKVSPLDIEEGMHVGYIPYTSLGFVKSVGRVDCNKYQIQIPLPPKIDSSVTMMTVEEKPNVTYNDIWRRGVGVSKNRLKRCEGWDLLGTCDHFLMHVILFLFVS